MRALLFLAMIIGNLLVLTDPLAAFPAAAEGPRRGEMSVQTVLTDGVGQSGVDHRLLECRTDPRLLHTAWSGKLPLFPGPHVCTGGANRLGAGYVRYLATSRMVKAHKPLRG
ncbi:hypothetical protein GKA01_16980 [Gluconobacter kanchanaburiensis NBRC 103587]|uniref:Uncharacterized protein n=2 Tax=Gluconobacter kanchanaburiensis TaxID=563199 RepID=A0A511B9U4_9PROT|nr:hypothetical protein [Gluconobacter kanchanaburiensis]MBF0862230.1 hypothetical protein [Gluconobacter kanchanaburiensis]GEK96501.1 hypothetical protein GKA01_16980 [Gluconobacter kanchanaburiensis NBRC 103587]